MRNIKFTLLLAFSIIIGGVSFASAQIPHGRSLRAYVPHDFVLRGQHFPPGEYTFDRVGITAPSAQLIMRGQNGYSAIFNTVRHRSVDGYGDTKLVFRNFNGFYFLSTIKLEGEMRGYEVPITTAERQFVARTFTPRRTVPVSTVAVTARR